MLKGQDTNEFMQVMQVTGITAPALARKLGVTTQEIRDWSVGKGVAPPACCDKLRKLLQIATIDVPSDRKQIQGPQLESAVVCADSLQYLAQMPDASIDLILSDIPYGIGLDDWDVLHGNVNSAYLGSSEGQQRAGKVFERRHKPINGWSTADRNISAEYYDWCKTWTAEWLRVLRPGGSAIVFAGRRMAHRCISALEDVGFNFRDLIAWHRPKAVFRAQRISLVFQKRAHLSDAKKWSGWRVGNLKPTFEPIIWCFKPYTLTIADNVLDHELGAMNVDRFAEITGSCENIVKIGYAPGERGLHEAQKPVTLMRALIELCTVPGQIVLDPYSGSGTTAVAAFQAGRRYIAVDRDASLCEIARKRISQC